MVVGNCGSRFGLWCLLQELLPHRCTLRVFKHVELRVGSLSSTVEFAEVGALHSPHFFDITCIKGSLKQSLPRVLVSEILLRLPHWRELEPLLVGVGRLGLFSLGDRVGNVAPLLVVLVVLVRREYALALPPPGELERSHGIKFNLFLQTLISFLNKLVQPLRVAH